MNSSLAAPQMQTWPRSGFTMPEIILSSVLLPEPDVPINAMIACGGTVRFTLFSTSIVWLPLAKLLPMPLNRMAGDVAPSLQVSAVSSV